MLGGLTSPDSEKTLVRAPSWEEGGGSLAWDPGPPADASCEGWTASALVAWAGAAWFSPASLSLLPLQSTAFASWLSSKRSTAGSSPRLAPELLLWTMLSPLLCLPSSVTYLNLRRVHNLERHRVLRTWNSEFTEFLELHRIHSLESAVSLQCPPG